MSNNKRKTEDELIDEMNKFPEIKIKITNAFKPMIRWISHVRYNEGYNEGFNKGYDDGYNEGLKISKKDKQ